MRLLCLGGGYESIPIIQRAADLNLNTIVVDGNEQAPARSLGAEFVQASCYDLRRTPGTLRANGLRFDGVLCAAVDAPHVAAEIRRLFGLPGLSGEAAALSVDKFRQKAILSAAGIPLPPFRKSGVTSWIGDASTASSFVVKPTDLRGGRGVIRLNEHADQQIRLSKSIALRSGGSGDLMLEAWLDGPQLSTESIVQNGRVLFTAIALRNYARLDECAPYVIEDGSDTPADLDEATRQSIDETIERACSALGWDNLTVKGDLVLHDGVVTVLELAARLSGGYFASDIIPAAYGVDFVGAAISLELGQEIKPIAPKDLSAGESARHLRPVCQRFIFPDEADIGRHVREIKPPKLNGEIVSATYHVTSGCEVRRVTSHPDRWGQVIAGSEAASGARKAAESAIKALKAGVKLA